MVRSKPIPREVNRPGSGQSSHTDKAADEPVNPDQPDLSRAAYMPYFVRMLAKRNPDRGGGAKRASTNADSYNQMMNAIFWHSISGRVPIVPDSKKAVVDQDEDPNQIDPTVTNQLPVMVDLGHLDINADVANAFDVKSLKAWKPILPDTCSLGWWWNCFR